MRIHPRIAWQAVAGEVVLVDLEGSRSLGLNPTGSFVWSRLESRSEAELASDLAGAFSVSRDQAATDVTAFLSFLRARGYVEE
jgi:Coenzyme PQQ synthesis protein D (PqqD)